MASAVFTYTAVPAGLLDLLSAHLPFSLPLLRRLQSTKWKSGQSPTSRIVFASDDGGPPQDAEANGGKHFTTAYLDPAAGPETQMWIYSTLEDGGLSLEGTETASRLVASVVNHSKSIGREHSEKLAYPGGILLGSLHSSVKEVMEATGISFSGRSKLGYDKWIFKVDELPSGELSLPDGMHWSPATREDCVMATSRTDIARDPDTLSVLPSTTIKLSDETPIAWAFLGLDGSLISLHCEEPYRCRGFARAVVTRLFRSSTRSFGDDMWCAADVSPDNEASIAVCMSLNGKQYWHLDWILLRI